MSRVPHIRDVLGASTAEMGVLAVAIAIGSISGMVGSSHVVARLGARRTMLVFVTILSVGVVIAGIGASLASFWVLFGGLVILGLGLGTTDVAMNVSAAACEQRLHRTLMPLFHALFSVGTMVGAGLGALAELWQVPVVVHVGVLNLACLVAVWLTNRFIGHELEGVGDDTGGTVADRLAVWKQPLTWLLGLIILGMALAEGSANDWLALAMVDGHNQSNTQGAISLGVFLTAMTVGRVLGIRLLDRFGRVPVLRGSAVLAALGLTAVIFLSHPVAVTIGIVAWGLGSALGFPVGMSAAADDLKTAAARVSAVATIGYVAFLGGPPLIGFLGQQVGLLRALLVVLVFIGVAGLVSPAARERRP
ncbi:MFS transporter [Tessaracoccus antarcticus]|uniref:MFS transporter n=2 Tax=Tessaracoccus antarcticus TaxID=2479848 RepID=A0A3M0G9A1_9ACTN|nr:MFS transporter [Tessaracoccus antarcticus]